MLLPPTPCVVDTAADPLGRLLLPPTPLCGYYCCQPPVRLLLPLNPLGVPACLGCTRQQALVVRQGGPVVGV